MQTTMSSENGRRDASPQRAWLAPRRRRVYYCSVRRSTLLTVPNLLSLSRLPMAAAFVMTSETPARLALIGTASATDMLDGWLARRGHPTRVGALLDPVADKIFVLAALSSFLFAGVIGTAQYFLVLSRDLATAVGFIVAYYVPGLDPTAFKARVSGKIVTVLQIAALLVLLLRPSDFRWILAPLVAASVWAIVDYTLMLHRTRVR
jgi:phosphatidylglycerophosphate synthase